MTIETSRFAIPGGAEERFLVLSGIPGKSFEAEAEELLSRCRNAVGAMIPLMVRFHLSDITNQARKLREILAREMPGAPFSLVGQMPLNGAHLVLEGWFTDRPIGQLAFLPGADPGATASYEQMAQLFRDLEQSLVPRRSVAEHVLRTWIYCRDIDNNYAGLVKARRDYFNSIGLTASTHYIASTGISGTAERPGQLVLMDVLTTDGISPEQIEYMHAPEHLSPTHIYGVTFERGVRLLHRDRSHYFLSGTASIDKKGEIVHPGDIAKQTERMLENVTALLEHHQGKLTDLAQAMVYLRDPADRDTVETILRERIGSHCALALLLAPVCRPGWLVELDGIAVNRCGDPAFPEWA